MFLEKLSILGYKNFRDEFKIEFQKGLNVLVGENGVGKSAIIDAIRLVLQEDEFGRTPISDSDFHKPFENPQKQSNLIEIQANFGALTQEEVIAFLPWTDTKCNATLTMQVDNPPKQNGRYKRVIWGGASKASMFEAELFDTIKCIFLPPLRDAESKLREGKTSRLARLLKNLNKKELAKCREAGELHTVEQKVKEFNEKLANDPEETIVKANNLIKDSLIEAMGNVFGQDTLIQFSEINLNRIVENLRLLFFPNITIGTRSDQFRSLDENSLGYNNLLYLATVLAELTHEEDEKSYVKILLIEEPEAHLHPQLQIRLLKYLEKTAQEKNVQIIITTHSTVIASSVTIDTLIHLTNSPENNFISTNLRDCGLSPKSKAFVNRWFDVTKSNLLFAKGVILVEGIAESMLLPVLAKSVLTKYNSSNPDQPDLPSNLEDAGVSVINMNGIYFKHFMQFFADLTEESSSNINIKCAGITDNDPPSDCFPTPEDNCHGSNPALELIATVNKSDLARLYAGSLKTFEYDLAMEAKNIPIMSKALIAITDTAGSIKLTLESYLKSQWDNIKVEEKRDAAKFLYEHIISKGLYAQVLADQLETEQCDIVVPVYIKKAVIWACGGIVNES
ncbi:MAG: AAA family ATPase [Bacteroidetes bacterium]|nr:AAA family ATPase [Bacteroidota bacterium]